MNEDVGDKPKTTVTKPIVFGNISRYLGKKRDEDGRTHLWTAFLRPFNANEDITQYVRRVQFKLHDSYPNPVRIFNKPPYELTETGWGEFDIVIKITFTDPNVKPLVITHLLKLFHCDHEIMMGKKSLVREIYDEMIFFDPSPSFYRALMNGSNANASTKALLPHVQHETDFGENKRQALTRILELNSKVNDAIISYREQLKLKKNIVEEARILADELEISCMGATRASAFPTKAPMEAVKIGRRRVHDLDCDGYRQMKRRMVNGLCHVEAGGGTWHVSAGLMPDKSMLNDVKAQQPHHLSKLDHGKTGGGQNQGDGGRNTGPDNLSNIPDPQPVLPPSLRESERMQSVERWINNLPTDAPVYAQTSLSDIVPISDPKSFPDDLNITEGQQQLHRDSSRGYEYYSSSSSQPKNHHLQSNPSTGTAPPLSSQQNCSSPQGYASLNPRSGQPPPLPNFVPTANTSAGGGAPLLGPRHPGGPTSPSAIRDCGARMNCAVQVRNGGKEDDHQFPTPNPTLKQQSQGGPCSTRFFDDNETQFVVKLFSDYFTSGSCPSLNEVRRRISLSLYQVQRNPTSIRAKVKRLQASGRWTDYAML